MADEKYDQVIVLVNALKDKQLSKANEIMSSTSEAIAKLSK